MSNGIRVSRELLLGEKYESLQSCTVYSLGWFLYTTGCGSLHLFVYIVFDSYTDGTMGGRLLCVFEEGTRWPVYST